MSSSTPTAKQPLLVSLAGIAGRLGTDRRTVLAMVEDDQLPRPVKLGRRKRWWDRQQVEAALAALRLSDGTSE
jgi:predicted DNA-binding transcriptional regulator AlpA